MSDLYRFKFHSDFFEIELESTDQSFIERKVMELIELSSKGYHNSPKLLSSAQHADLEPVETAAEEAVAEEVEAVPKVAKKPKKTAAARPKAKAAKPKAKPARGATAKKATKAAPPAAPQKSGGDLEAQAIADHVKSLEYYDVFKKRILDKANQLNRILLSFYYAHQINGDKPLTTGDIESITHALGTEIKSTNVSSQIKKHKDLFIIEGERKRGAVVYYKLNKKGINKFEETVQSILA